MAPSDTDLSRLPGLTTAPLTAADLDDWAALVNALAVADQTGEFYQPADLAEELAAADFDARQDSWLVRSEGEAVGYVKVSVPLEAGHDARAEAWIEGGVLPQHRGRGIGRALMGVAEERARVLLTQRHPGRVGVLRSGGGIDGASARPMLEHRGYQPVRWFNLLRRPLPGADLAPVDLPAGVTLQPWTDDLQEAVHAAHDAAFADHWGSGPHTADQWREHWTSRSSRRELSFAAVDEDGVVLAYAGTGQWVERELYVNIVGTIRSARGQGLGHAVLSRVLAEAAATGRYDRIELEVDSASPTGAGRLYAGLGFEPARTTSVHERTA
ncbi:GNAT family N-acetyltransferase [Dermacoccaceae bacterium W4C1]